MPSYYGSKKFPYLYNARHTIEELEELYERTGDRRGAKYAGSSMKESIPQREIRCLCLVPEA